jgi:hypothetical protein
MTSDNPKRFYLNLASASAILRIKTIGQVSWVSTPPNNLGQGGESVFLLLANISGDERSDVIRRQER